MNRYWGKISLRSFCFSVALLAFFTGEREATAAQLTLAWGDASSNEDGFKIERKTGTAGTFAQIVTAAVNTTSYPDATLADNATYCYRVKAYNTAGDSTYSNEACGTPATTSVTLDVTKTGTGNGTVTSAPAGISCGATCSASYTSGTSVTLTPTPAAGSTFSGWTGDTDCSDGGVSMTVAKTCTATFAIAAPSTYSLTVTKTGIGSGTVTSASAGINCGATCSASYTSGSSVTLTPAPATGSTFSGWTGDTDCSDGGVSMNAAKTCTATFALTAPNTYSLTVTKTGSGSGTVTSAPAGISCGADCSEAYASGTSVTLSATPAVGSIFSGWSGACTGTGACTIPMSAAKSVTATFNAQTGARIGVFRPSTGKWYFDLNGNGKWDDSTQGGLVTFGTPGTHPVVGDWTGTGFTQIGMFNKVARAWKLDRNGNDLWEGCTIDLCVGGSSWRWSDIVPVIGRWKKGAIGAMVGVYRAGNAEWRLDLNANGVWDHSSVDSTRSPFGGSTQLPVVGDWTGTTTTKIGTFAPATGLWKLDKNDNGKLDACGIDGCFGPFGITGDLPVAGDWTGTGTAKIGVFDPLTSMWELDRNGNGLFDGCAVDICLGPFGVKGDIPVVGKW